MKSWNVFNFSEREGRSLAHVKKSLTGKTLIDDACMQPDVFTDVTIWRGEVHSSICLQSVFFRNKWLIKIDQHGAGWLYA